MCLALVSLHIQRSFLPAITSAWNSPVGGLLIEDTGSTKTYDNTCATRLLRRPCARGPPSANARMKRGASSVRSTPSRRRRTETIRFWVCRHFTNWNCGSGSFWTYVEWEHKKGELS